VSVNNKKYKWCSVSVKSRNVGKASSLRTHRVLAKSQLQLAVLKPRYLFIKIISSEGIDLT
jgi:hypothetical protein